jgi:hypothetical protein
LQVTIKVEEPSPTPAPEEKTINPEKPNLGRPEIVGGAAIGNETTPVVTSPIEDSFIETMRAYMWAVILSAGIVIVVIIYIIKKL